MSGITVANRARNKVQYAQEEGHEHLVLVVPGQGVVHDGGNARRGGFVKGNGPEQGAGLGHYQRSRNAFTGNIADTEEQFFVTDIIVVQVAAHFLGGNHGGGKVQIGPVREGREGLGYHGHLDVVADLKFALEPFLLFAGHLVIGQTFCHKTHDKDQHKQAQNGEHDHTQDD